jgi:hypothetical protein
LDSLPESLLHVHGKAMPMNLLLNQAPKCIYFPGIVGRSYQVIVRPGKSAAVMPNGSGDRLITTTKEEI